MEPQSAATWKTVNTLAFRKKKQRAPASEQPGWAAQLSAASASALDSLSGAGVPGSAYLTRLSEIQLQDEAYIHQQLVKPDEAKAKRTTMRRMLRHSASKGSGSGRGVRLSRPGSLSAQGSRRVRFHDAAASSPKAAASSGSSSPLAVSMAPPAGAKASTAAKAAGAAKAARFADPPATAPAPEAAGACAPLPPQARPVARPGRVMFSSTDQHELQPDAGQREPQAQRTDADSTRPAAHDAPCQPASPEASPAAAPAAGAAASLQQISPAGSVAATLTPRSSQLPPQPPAGSLMARFLQQQSAEPPADAAASAASSSSPAALHAGAAAGGWAGDAGPSHAGSSGCTELADKQLQALQRLRASAAGPASPAPGAAAAPEPGSLCEPLGYRPLAIPEELFARWSSASTGGGNSAAPAAPAASSGGGGAAAAPAANASASGGMAAARASPGQSRRASGSLPGTAEAAGARTASRRASLERTPRARSPAHGRPDGLASKQQQQRQCCEPGGILAASCPAARRVSRVTRGSSASSSDELPAITGSSKRTSNGLAASYSGAKSSRVQLPPARHSRS